MVRKRLVEAIAASKFNATSLSGEIGRGKDYVRDFIDGKKDSLGGIETVQIERLLGLSRGYIDGIEEDGAEPSTARAAPGADTLEAGARDVPILGTSVGGKAGEFYLNGDTVDFARRLPGIATTKNVFGVYVEGESMVPKFEPGELVYASPRTPAPGDYVIVELTPKSEERAGPAYIKRLVRRSGNKVVCEQFNPKKTVEYDAREVKALYRIIPLAELAGF